MICQVCITPNPDDSELCSFCQNKLLVIAGGRRGEEEDVVEEGGFSLEEHLLERISILEEVVKRTGDAVRTILSALHKQEENILINHAGLATVRELLEGKAVVAAEDWDDLWESKLNEELLAREKRDRFNAIKDRISVLYEGDRRGTFERHLEDAEYAFYAFEVQSGLRSLESAFRLDKKNHALAHFLGESYFHDGDGERAERYFGAVLAERPDHYEGLVYSGVIEHRAGRHAAAEGYLSRAVTLYAGNFLPHFVMGAVCAAQGSVARAAVYLERAIGLDQVPQAHYLLGSCYYEMGKTSAAVRVLSDAVRLDPGFEECYYLLGLCYLDRHWNRKALDAFRQAQRLSPRKMRYADLVSYLSGHQAALPAVSQEARDWLERGQGRLQRGESREALRFFKRAIRAEPENPLVLMTYALACGDLNRHQEIRSTAMRVIDSNPGDLLRATAYATLIAALRSEGNYREGNKLGQQLLAEGSSDFSRSIAYYEMAYNLAEMDQNLDEALDLARRALSHSPDELRQFPLAALGWIHYKRREFDKAVDFLSQSSELGANATTLTHLGMALLASGEKENARLVLDRARELSQSDSGALGEKMLEYMRNSARILERVRRRD